MTMVSRPTRRARLRKVVDIETETRTFEVRHEQARIEYEPVSGSANSNSAAQLLGDGGGRWMVIDDEEVVVTTRRVPRERVRLRTHLVTEQIEVREVIRMEHVEIQRHRTPGTSA